MKKGRIMKTYSNDKTLKILLALMIVGLFLNFFKPMLKDALAADIDCLIMKDELMERIAYSEITLKELITRLQNFSNRNQTFNYLLAIEENNISKKRLNEISMESVNTAFNY